MFNCEVCGKAFTRKDNFVRHSKTHSGSEFSCSLCNTKFTYKTNLTRHEENVHHIVRDVVKQQQQPLTETIVAVNQKRLSNQKPQTSKLWEDDEISDLPLDGNTNQDLKRKHENTIKSGRVKQARLQYVGDSVDFVNIGTSFNNKITFFYKKNLNNFNSYKNFLASCKTQIVNLLKTFDLPIKLNLKLEATYNIPHVQNSSENRAFKTSARAIFQDSDINTIIDESFNKLLIEEETYTSKGSGYSLQNIDGILLYIYKYSPMHGSSYIKLPVEILNKKAIINPQNTDHQCFKWAILAKYISGGSKHHVGDNYRSIENKYNFTGLSFPTPRNEIQIFERNNPNVSVNVYALKEEKKNKHIIIPLRVVNEEKTDHFDLLWLTDKDNSHYTYIINFSRLVSNQCSLHNHSIYICKRCFTHFDNREKKFKLNGQAALDQHKLICGEHKPILPIMPEEGSILEFKAWVNCQRLPFIIFADFEALLLKLLKEIGKKTVAFQSHHPMSYGYIVIASDDVPLELLKQYNIPTTPVIYRGSEEHDGVAKMFVADVTETAKKIADLLKNTKKSIIMSDEELRRHNLKTNCDLCKNKFLNNKEKIQDHCHLSGKFRQTLCNKCNLSLRTTNFVPCFLHNLTNYDAHFIVQELGYDINKISVIPNSEEKYIAFSKYITNSFTIRFVDTYRFMASKLSTLAKNLLTPDFKKFRETSKVFKTEDLPLVTRKGVYPYDYTDSWAKLKERVLPPKTEFYSSLTEEDIKDDEYEHAMNVWNHFNCKTLGDYSDLYLKIDVLLLADVFENFRDICLKTYNLDPAYYFTAPGMAFDCMLKYTNIKLELLNDYDMLLLYEKGIRGGLTQSSMRYGKANNFKTPDFDTSQHKSWIIYQDCNNLYGWAMSQYMPYGGFKWVEPTLDGLNNLTETSDVGRVYEVDIAYPQHLHDDHNNLPFLPCNGIPPGSNVRKLMATLEPKKKYIVHYRNLQQAIAHGLIVEKVYRVLEFKQSPWLAKYINLNTEMRKRAVNEFEKDFFKLMNNAVFGKTMESMRKRVKMELVSSPLRMQKLINKPTFKHCTIYSENLAAVSLENKVIEFCKPIYIGFAVLDISKTLMFDYHYNVMKAHYKDNINLMYTDTDSLVYHIMTEDFYSDLLQNPNLLTRMDTANLPQDHPCYLAERKKIPGYFSDETDGRIIYEFIALRAKSYAFSIDGKKNIEEKIKAKGIRGHIVKHHMTLEDHKKCLFGNDSKFNPYTNNFSIRSFKHQLKTINSQKLTYNNHDDKRFVLEDQIHTLAWGHYKIEELLKKDDLMVEEGE